MRRICCARFDVCLVPTARLALNIPVGLAADRLKDGPRPLLIGGGLLAAAGTAACGLATDVNQLLAARLIAGAGNAAYLGSAQIYLAGELSTPTTRTQAAGQIAPKPVAS